MKFLRDIGRWIGRGFGIRIGFAIAVVLLGLIGMGEARADPACPAGKVSEWTVYQTTTVFGAPGVLGCSVGSKGSDAMGLVQQCVPSHGTYASGDRHWEGTFTPSYNGTSALYDPDARIFFNSSETQAQLVNDFVKLSHACVDAPQCEIPAGTRVGSAQDTDPEEICFSNCKAGKVLSASWSFDGAPAIDTYLFSSTGAVCDGTVQVLLPADADKVCAEGPGLALCLDKSQGGVLTDDAAWTGNNNPDDSTSVAQLESQGCVVLASGGGFCINDATNKPDAGVPGTTAQASATGAIKAPDSGKPSGSADSNVNYYSSSVINNSTNYGSGDPDGDGSDSTGECDPNTESCGSGRGRGRYSGPGGSAATFAEALSAFQDTISEAPIVSALDTFSSVIPNDGDCPTADFSIWGSTFALDAHCIILDQYYSQIAQLALLFWLILGAVVIMRA